MQVMDMIIKEDKNITPEVLSSKSSARATCMTSRFLGPAKKQIRKGLVT